MFLGGKSENVSVLGKVDNIFQAIFATQLDIMTFYVFEDKYAGLVLLDLYRKCLFSTGALGLNMKILFMHCSVDFTYSHKTLV